MFRACSIGAVSTMGPPFWVGIAATEVRAACALLRIARGEWPELAGDVQFMGSEVASERNQRQRRESGRKLQ